LFETKTAQHAALSRIEAYYESSQDTRNYLTLDQARLARQCQNYEAFNFPIDVVKRWLAGMEEVHCPDGKPASQEGDEDRDLLRSPSRETHWWYPFCNDQERCLLSYLNRLGILDDVSTSEKVNKAPVYLISTLQDQQSSLRHERLHFLYFFSEEYRTQVKLVYETLSSRALRIIQQDLTMRKYSPDVWVDEFQAYISEDAGEFGSSVKAECQGISQTLRQYQTRLWNEINSNQ
jgi:hypothetical protein